MVLSSKLDPYYHIPNLIREGFEFPAINMSTIKYSGIFWFGRAQNICSEISNLNQVILIGGYNHFSVCPKILMRFSWMQC